MKKHTFSVLVLIVVGVIFMPCIAGCDNGTTEPTNENTNGKSITMTITVTGISGEKEWAYARIGIFSNFEDENYLAVSKFMPISNGEVTGELKDTTNIPWNDNGEFYIEVLLSMIEGASGQRVLYLYTNGTSLDLNNVPKYTINSTTTTIPFNMFKKEDEAQ
jgi:hypothetical protein